ncbi:MAG: oligosaccharide flippase family protein [bacterium]
MSAGNPVVDNDSLKSLAKGGSFILFGTISRKILTLAFSWILALLLGPGGVGMFWLAMAVYSISVMVGSLGFPQGLVRYISKEGNLRGFPAWHKLAFLAVMCGLACSLVTGIALVFLSAPLAASLLKDEEFRWVFRLVAFSVPFGVLTSLFLSITQGLKDMLPTMKLAHLMDISLKIVIFLLLSLLGWKLGGALSAHAIASVLICWLSYNLVRRTVNLPWTAFAFTLESKNFMVFSAWMLSCNLLYVLVEWVSTIMVGHFLVPAEVGIFGMALRWATVCGLFLTAFNPIFAPLLSEALGKKDTAVMRRLYQAEVRWVITATAPFLIILLLFAEPLLALAGQEFARGAPVLRIIAAGVFINAATGSASDFFIMAGWTKFVFFSSVATCAMNIALSFLLIPQYGIIGAALATATTTAFMNIFCASCVMLVFRIGPYTAKLLKPLTAACLSTAVGLFAKTAFFANGWPASAAVTGIAYLAFIRLFGIDEEDMQVMPKRLKFLFGKR